MIDARDASTHAGLIFTPEELLMTLVAERLDRLADRMVRCGHSKLAILGRLAHADWLHERIHGMRAFPIVAYAPTPWIDEDHDGTYRGIPVVTLGDPRLPTITDTILISDDLYEDALRAEALRAMPPGVIIHRLYERLPIGCKRPERITTRGVRVGWAATAPAR
jgi:hypothetical protein